MRRDPAGCQAGRGAPRFRSSHCGPRDPKCRSVLQARARPRRPARIMSSTPRPGSIVSNRSLKRAVRWRGSRLGRAVPSCIRSTRPSSTAPRPVNARAETVAHHPMFAGSFRERRAIVPADVYYQRRTRGGTGLFAVSRKDGRPMAIAGLWEWFKCTNGDIIRTYCTITTVANTRVAPIHRRMPVILEEEDWPIWLGEQPGDPAALLHAPPADVLQIQHVRETASDSRRHQLRSQLRPPSASEAAKQQHDSSHAG
jgi:putative SOS response-associated peptidase YedK